jgi:membrane protease YdiL (CAAX protease family)
VTPDKTAAFELSAGCALAIVAIEVAVVLATHFASRQPRDFPRRPAALSSRFALEGIALFCAWLLLYFGAALVATILLPGVSSARPFRLVITAPAAIVVFLMVATAVFEEVVAAAWMIDGLARHGAAISVGVSTAARFLFHLYQGPLAAISVIPVGLLLGAVYWRTRNVWPLVIAHAFGSIVVFALAGSSGV